MKKLYATLAMLTITLLVISVIVISASPPDVDPELLVKWEKQLEALESVGITDVIVTDSCISLPASVMLDCGRPMRSVGVTSVEVYVPLIDTINGPQIVPDSEIMKNDSSRVYIREPFEIKYMPYKKD